MPPAPYRVSFISYRWDWGDSPRYLQLLESCIDLLFVLRFHLVVDAGGGCPIICPHHPILISLTIDEVHHISGVPHPHPVGDFGEVSVVVFHIVHILSVERPSVLLFRHVVVRRYLLHIPWSERAIFLLLEVKVLIYLIGIVLPHRKSDIGKVTINGFDIVHISLLFTGFKGYSEEVDYQ